VAPYLERGAPAWGAKASTLFWRGSPYASALHKALIPALLKSSGAVAAGLHPSVTLDIKADVGGRAAKQPAKQSAKQAKQQSASKAGRGMPPLQLHPLVALADQCKHKFLLHLDGISDGASLKYKLACGSVVIVVRSPNEEFYHHALFRRLDNPEAGSSGGDPKGSPGGLTQRSGHGRPSSHVVVSVEPPPPRFFRLLEKRIEPQLRHSLLRNSPRLTPCIYTYTYAYTHTYTYMHIHAYLPELHNCPQLAHARTMHVCIPYASARVILFLCRHRIHHS